MAQLHPKPYPGFERKDGEDYREYSLRTSKLFDELVDAASKLPAGAQPGKILQWPYADGYAFYSIKSVKPFVLQHIPFGDAWRIDAATIRGLRVSDIR